MDCEVLACPVSSTNIKAMIFLKVEVDVQKGVSKSRKKVIVDVCYKVRLL